MLPRLEFIDLIGNTSAVRRITIHSVALWVAGSCRMAERKFEGVHKFLETLEKAREEEESEKEQTLPLQKVSIQSAICGWS